VMIMHMLIRRVTITGNTLIVNPNSNLVDTGTKTYTVTMSWGIIQDMNNNFFPGLAGTTYQFNVLDETAPLVTNYAPLGNSANNNKAVNLVLTFNEYVQAGSGSIVLTPTGGNGNNNAISIVATDTNQVGFYTTQMTLNPSSDLVDTGGKLYTVTMASGVLKDMGNVAYAGLTGDAYKFNVADSTAPSIAVYSPGNASNSALKDTDIVLTFTEYVQAGTGSIVVTPSGGTGPNTALSIPIADAQVTLTTTAANPNGVGKLTIDLTNTLVTTGTKTFSVTMPNTALKDSVNNAFPGTTPRTATAYVFSVPDVDAPTVTGYAPAQAATGQSNAADVVLTFSEFVQAGTGTIILIPGGGNQANTPVSIAVGDAQVSFSTNTVTINPTNSLKDQGGKSYTVRMNAGVIKDGSPTTSTANSYAGLAGATYVFNIDDTTAPLVTLHSPLHESQLAVVTDNVVFTFDENVQAGTGNVVLTPSGGTGANTALTIAIGDAQVTITGGVAGHTAVTVNPTADLITTGTKTYTVTMASGVLKDLKDNAYTGLTGTAYIFTIPDVAAPIIQVSSDDSVVTLALTVAAGKFNIGGSYQALVAEERLII
jgi:large repetitive protein